MVIYGAPKRSKSFAVGLTVVLLLHHWSAGLYSANFRLGSLACFQCGLHLSHLARELTDLCTLRANLAILFFNHPLLLLIAFSIAQRMGSLFTSR